MDAINIRGRRVRCLRHGMAGAPGLEVWGPYAQADEIREAILEAGGDLRLVLVGARAHPRNTPVPGWNPPPLPPVDTGRRVEKEPRRLAADGDHRTAPLLRTLPF